MLGAAPCQDRRGRVFWPRKKCVQCRLGSGLLANSLLCVHRREVRVCTVYTLDLVSWTGNKSYERSIIWYLAWSGVSDNISSCLRLRIDTQFDVFKLIVHGCSIIYKVVYLLWPLPVFITHNKPCPSLETIERIESLMWMQCSSLPPPSTFYDLLFWAEQTAASITPAVVSIQISFLFQRLDIFIASQPQLRWKSTFLKHYTELLIPYFRNFTFVGQQARYLVTQR